MWKRTKAKVVNFNKCLVTADLLNPATSFSHEFLEYQKNWGYCEKNAFTYLHSGSTIVTIQLSDLRSILGKYLPSPGGVRLCVGHPDELVLFLALWCLYRHGHLWNLLTSLPSLLVQPHKPLWPSLRSLTQVLLTRYVKGILNCTWLLTLDDGELDYEESIAARLFTLTWMASLWQPVETPAAIEIFCLQFLDCRLCSTVVMF